MKRRLPEPLLTLLMAVTTAVVATTVSAEVTPEEHFELEIRPLLADKCTHCHSGDDDAEPDLAFRSREELLAGGDYGPAIIPGRGDESLLIRAVD